MQWQTPSSMEKYNQNKLRQWTCGSTGYESVNANNNFEFTCDGANLIMPITGQSRITSLQHAQRFPHTIHRARNVMNRTTTPAYNSSLRSITVTLTWTLGEGVMTG
jgi:hypothetical protein